MASLNMVTLMGYLTKDPEVRYTNDNRAIANVSMATNERWKDKQTGEYKDKPEYHRVVVFNQMAEVVEKYLKKGSHVHFIGKLQTRKWTDNNGVEKYTTEVVVDMKGQMIMLGGKATEKADDYPTKDNYFDDESTPF